MPHLGAYGKGASTERDREELCSQLRAARRVTQLDVLTNTAEKLLSLAQNLIERLPNRFLQVASKASYATLNTLLTAAWLTLPALAIALGIATYQFLRQGTRLPIIATAQAIWLHPAYLVYGVITLTLMLRRFRFRFLDSDHP